jgi:hypothetical protein
MTGYFSISWATVSFCRFWSSCTGCEGHETNAFVELSYFATDNWSDIQSVLVSSPSVTPDQILAEGKTFRGLMSLRVFPDGRMDPSSLPDPLLGSSSLDPPRSHLYSAFYWSILVSVSRQCLVCQSLNALVVYTTVTR